MAQWNVIATLRADVDELECEWPYCTTIMRDGMAVQLIRADRRPRRLVCSDHNVDEESPEED